MNIIYQIINIFIVCIGCSQAKPRFHWHEFSNWKQELFSAKKIKSGGFYCNGQIEEQLRLLESELYFTFRVWVVDKSICYLF